MMRGILIDMNDEQLYALVDLQVFLTGTVAKDFTVAADEQYELSFPVCRNNFLRTPLNFF